MKTETKRPLIVVESPDDADWMTFDVDGVGVLTARPTTFTKDIQSRLMYHGLKQKVIDAAAIGYKQADGTFRRPTAGEKFDAMEAVLEHLQNGEWNARRGEPTSGLLFEALCRMYEGKRTPESIREWLAGRDAKQKAKLVRLPRIREIMDAIRAERNPDAVMEAEDLLETL